MSNNRLYIGNKKTEEYLMLAKGFASGWDQRNDPKLLASWWEDHVFFEESEIGGKTSLVVFTEYDHDLYDEFMRNGVRIDNLPK